MTPYKGIIKISCADTTCRDKLTQPAAGCCDRAHLEILDLENKVIAESSKLKAQSSKPKTTTKKSLKGPKVDKPGTQNPEPITDN